jgi:predicted enzyme related to lactoylglutathione lyase
MANPIVHWELVVSDLDKASEFYTNVFQWQIEGLPAFPGYPMVDPGKEPRGAMMVKPESAPGYSFNVYFGVDSVEQTLTRAVGAGGTLLVPETPIEGMGVWGMFAVPDGIPIGVYHPK